MDGPEQPDAAVLARRLKRERAARREAEGIAERVTGDLYKAVNDLEAFKAILEQTTDFVAFTDADGRPEYLNGALCELFGVEGTETETVNLVDRLTPSSRRLYFDEVVRTLGEKGSWRGEMAWLRPDGTEIAVSQVLVATRTATGRVEGVGSISRDVTAERAHRERLAHAAEHDPLTGLANRRLFFDRLESAGARARRAGTRVGVLFIDLDGFKAINDTLGHDAGDTVLLAVADRLRAGSRTVDTLARVGGDEFAVVCEGITDAATLVRIAERLSATVGQPLDVGESTLRVSISIGIALASGDDGGLDDVVAAADAAMYRAKAAGQGGWEMHGGSPSGEGE